MPINNSQQHLRECEARYWLKACNYDADKIKQRLDVIRSKRGKAGEQALAAEMRKQWRIERA